MDVQIGFKNKRNTIHFDEEAPTLHMLMLEIEKQMGVKTQNQKIICRGKPLKDPEVVLQKGMKLLLTEEQGPLVVTNKSTTPSRTYSFFKPQIIDTLKEQYHQNVIQMGPPDGFTKPIQFQASVLPQTPIYVRNGQGTTPPQGSRCALSFESDALCLITDDLQVERIFISDITRATSLPIPNYDGFLALGIITKQGNKWIYFIPQQFQQILRSLLPQ